MPIKKRRVQGIWSSRWTFFAAAVALTAGLGDFWATPLYISQQGGALYLLCYLFFLAVVMMPLAVAELRIAVKARANPIHAFDHFITYASSSRYWRLVPVIAVVAVVLLVARMCVVGGWLLAYIPQMLAPEMLAASVDSVAGVFTSLLADSGQMVKNSLIFLVVVALFASMEVGKGLAMLLRVLLPLMMIMLVLLVYYAYELGDARVAHTALLEFRPDQFSWSQGFSALQQAFFTLCAGSFALMAFGAYFPVGRSVDRQIAMVASLDVLIMLMAGILILALVADQHILPGTGPALLFISLPYTFGNLIFGDLVGVAFFVLLSIFMLTSAVALLEPLVAHGVERWAAPRWLIAPAVAVFVGGLSVLSIDSLLVNPSAENAPQGFLGHSLWEWLDILAGAILLPLAAFLFSLFAGWRIPRVVYGSPDGVFAKMAFWLWYQLLRYIAPPVLFLVLVVGCYARFS
ncbi:hypothetical protein IB286_09730 [Spongiibacter sp. KMU-158]|uniref:Sodium-dependent transporter n=1 Tax=Spongiibacter pelagi TaxID=2760804 RepID=A0A927C3R8_9GAMM|nr:hypothetical protein [Spongiibacter pelagi]MBD2859287.1 hypothetical protein [Spongiibacter pelagi]